MLKSALLATLCLGLSTGSMETMMKIKNHINTWNWDVQCWGEINVAMFRMMEKIVCEQCMQMPTDAPVSQYVPKMAALHSSPIQNSIVPANFQQLPAATYNLGYPYANAWGHQSPYAHHHGKRGANDAFFDAEEFMQNAMKLKEDSASKMSNLTCILKSMGVIDSDYKINRAMFETEIWGMKDLSATSNLADPVWRQKMSGMWTDCIDMAESLPQTMLDNNPIYRMMGPLARFCKFNKCKKVRNLSMLFYITNQTIIQHVTKKLCGAAQAEKLIQKFHGSLNLDPGQFGLEDKYEAALMTAMVMMESKSPEMEFVENIFHGDM